MNWFAARRRDFILWRLAVHGEVYRGKITEHFDVSEAQASVDINAFIADWPDSISYDKSRKRYIAKRHRPEERLVKMADAHGWD